MAKDQVQYVVDLTAPRHIEQVECDVTSGGTPVLGLCELRRFGRLIATFVVSPGQRLKIKRGKGKLNITSKMIELAYYAKKGYWHGYAR
jgi:hypothetical protein